MYKIGELAKRYQVKTDTLRFYEKQGLLIPSMRSDSGYRYYDKQDEYKLRFILRAKGVGFSLLDIQQLLSIELDKENRVCAESKTIVDNKLVQVEAQINELMTLRASLKQLSDSCCGGDDLATQCSILEALAIFEHNVDKENVR